MYNKKLFKYEKEKWIVLICLFVKDVEVYLFLFYVVLCNCKIIDFIKW